MNLFSIINGRDGRTGRSGCGPCALRRAGNGRLRQVARLQDRPEEINMPTLNDLIDGDAQRLDTGFTFTEGPLYHPDGFYYFVDVRESKFYRIKPGEKAELLRENTGEGNGTTFDPQGRLIQCEGGNRRVTRWPADGTVASSEVLMDRFNGKACYGRTMSSASPTVASISPIRGYAFRSSNASSTRRRSTGSHPTAATSTSPISNTRTGSP